LKIVLVNTSAYQLFVPPSFQKSAYGTGYDRRRRTIS